MNRAEQVLAASRKAYREAQERRGFSSASADVRAWEPEPTLELARAFVPKKIESMYARTRITTEASKPTPAEPRDTFWNRSN